MSFIKKITMFTALATMLYVSPAIAKNNSDSLQIKGSDTMVNLVQAWAEEYMGRNPESFIAVTGGGSGTGIAALINGSCDITMSSRNVTEKEIGMAKAKGSQPVEHRVALDGLAVVVHPKNPISKLTMDQLADIFSGKIKNWKEVGGEDAAIVVLSREVNSGTHVYFKEHVLRKNDSKSKEEFSPEALLLPSSQAIADEIKHNQHAVGYYGMGYVSKDQKALALAPAAETEFVAPTVENVISGHYPVSRPLFLYTNGEGSADAQKFMAFVLSSEGQKIVTTLDFVPIQA